MQEGEENRRYRRGCPRALKTNSPTDLGTAHCRNHAHGMWASGANPYRIIAASALASPPFSANGVAKRNTLCAGAFSSPSRVAHAMISVLLVPLRSAQHMTSIAGMNGMLFAQTATRRGRSPR